MADDEIATPMVAYSRELIPGGLPFKRGDQVVIDGITAKVVDIRSYSDDGRDMVVALATPAYLAARRHGDHEAPGCSS